MQYSTLFVCVCSHDQVMNTWCFRSVWWLDASERSVSRAAARPPVWPVQHRSVTLPGSVFAAQNREPCRPLFGTCEKLRVLQVSLETFKNSVLIVYIFFIDIKVPSFQAFIVLHVIVCFIFSQKCNLKCIDGWQEPKNIQLTEENLSNVTHDM